ncbi:MAG: MarR family transcriptional regulator [Lachnospiraceae bacterium]|nr:MarR family transcriptional regulator [Lachnospiraceae bacterium]
MREEMQHRIIDLFRNVDRSIKRSIEKKVEGTGVYRSQHRMLMILGCHPEISQTELAEKLEISPAAVAVSLKKLEKSGYISRQCNENDNRVNDVTVTEKGRLTIEVSVEYFKEMESALMKDFTMEELQILESYFRRIIANGEAYYQDLLNQEK